MLHAFTKSHSGEKWIDIREQIKKFKQYTLKFSPIHDVTFHICHVIFTISCLQLLLCRPAFSLINVQKDDLWKCVHILLVCVFVCRPSKMTRWLSNILVRKGSTPNDILVALNDENEYCMRNLETFVLARLYNLKLLSAQSMSVVWMYPWAAYKRSRADRPDLDHEPLLGTRLSLTEQFIWGNNYHFERWSRISSRFTTELISCLAVWHPPPPPPPLISVN
jgi:hypothetical protein